MLTQKQKYYIITSFLQNDLFDYNSDIVSVVNWLHVLQPQAIYLIKKIILKHSRNISSDQLLLYMSCFIQIYCYKIVCILVSCRVFWIETFLCAPRMPLITHIYHTQQPGNRHSKIGTTTGLLVIFWQNINSTASYSLSHKTCKHQITRLKATKYTFRVIWSPWYLTTLLLYALHMSFQAYILDARPK